MNTKIFQEKKDAQDKLGNSSITSSQTFDLVIAGAGIMGLSCALEEAKRGKYVVLIDSNPIGQKASHAAAGILVTRDAHTFASAFREFYVRSIQMYPEWLEELTRISGQSIPFQRVGDYQIFNLENAEGEKQFLAKTEQLERERAKRFNVSDKLPEFLQKKCPLKRVKVLYFPEEAYVQNRDLMQALLQACIRSGVKILASVDIQGIEENAFGVQLKTETGNLQGKQLLISAGAWSGKLLSYLGYSAPLLPVKGQLYRIPKFYSETSMVHYQEDLYFVPRGNSLVIGATTEAGIWDEGYNDFGKSYLDQKMQDFLPNIPHQPLETWTGLRPRSKDRLPLMGFVNSKHTIALCTGHYKCGISMAPLAGICMSNLLNGEKPKYSLEPFDPLRKKGLQKI